MIEEKKLGKKADAYSEGVVSALAAGGPRAIKWEEVRGLISSGYSNGFQSGVVWQKGVEEARKADAPDHCDKMANYRIDFVTARGQDHAFACADHLVKILPKALEVCRGGAARMSRLSGSSEEPCEVDVE